MAARSARAAGAAELIARSPDVAVTYTNLALAVLKPTRCGSIPTTRYGYQTGQPMPSCALIPQRKSSRAFRAIAKTPTCVSCSAARARHGLRNRAPSVSASSGTRRGPIDLAGGLPGSQRRGTEEYGKTAVEACKRSVSSSRINRARERLDARRVDRS
jgi:hypothetical protein